jgi:hypothetical protein
MVSENQVKKDCLEYLKLMGFKLYWRQNTGGAKYTTKAGKNHFVRFGFRGISDILAVLPPNGRFLAVETKRIDNDASDDQRDFMRDVEGVGGIAVLAYSVDDLDARLRKEGYVK